MNRRALLGAALAAPLTPAMASAGTNRPAALTSQMLHQIQVQQIEAVAISLARLQSEIKALAAFPGRVA